ncbi:hypothetical protein F511_15334 [Dorcoceras hygrometricum]|uniref:Uncharacterized protein n=1 Tax=Dorcoceras hygrometricum TaxID=472368 RepID=A0A2Z7CQ67_9LAMI|nr:hypothetical protein F511_15334 [Dorcoceras hygrometricum]
MKPAQQRESTDSILIESRYQCRLRRVQGRTVRGRPSWSSIGKLSWYSEGTPELIQLRTTRKQSGSVKEETSWDGNQLGNKLSANQLEDQLREKPAQQPAGRDQPRVQQPAQWTDQLIVKKNKRQAG